MQIMRYSLLLILAVAVAHLGLSQGQKDPSALTILEAMSAKYKSYPSFEASFIHSLVDPDGSKEDFTGTVTVKGDKYKLDVGGQEITNDGKTVWTYLEEVNEVSVSDYYPEDEEISLSNIFSIYEDGYKYVYVEEKDSGKTHVIDLEPEASGKDIYKIRMEIASNNDLRSFTLFERSGVKYLYAIDKFNGNINITDSFFVWDENKYPGVEVIDFRY